MTLRPNLHPTSSVCLPQKALSVLRHKKLCPSIYSALLLSHRIVITPDWTIDIIYGQ